MFLMMRLMMAISSVISSVGVIVSIRAIDSVVNSVLVVWLWCHVMSIIVCMVKAVMGLVIDRNMSVMISNTMGFVMRSIGVLSFSISLIKVAQWAIKVRCFMVRCRNVMIARIMGIVAIIVASVVVRGEMLSQSVRITHDAIVIIMWLHEVAAVNVSILMQKLVMRRLTVSHKFAFVSY